MVAGVEDTLPASTTAEHDEHDGRRMPEHRAVCQSEEIEGCPQALRCEPGAMIEPLDS